MEAKHLDTPKEKPASATREELERRVVAGYESLMLRLAGMHAPEFLEIGITMPQAKTLYLVTAAGELHMSALVAALGVSLSTVSGLVDRLVDRGLVARRDDPADRRQVFVASTSAGLALTERFRELNAHLLQTLLRGLADDDLVVVARALEILDRSAGAQLGASVAPADPERNPA